MKTNQSRPTRCASCKRRVENPIIIAGLAFGSECQHKVATLEGYLKSYDLELPANIPMLPGSSNGFYCPDVERIRVARNAAARAGIDTIIFNTFDGANPVTEIRIGNIKSALERIALAPRRIALETRTA